MPETTAGPSVWEGFAPPVTPGTTGTDAGQKPVQLAFTFMADRQQLFQAFPALAKLADKCDGGKVVISVGANSSEGFDPFWLRNAVEEPLDEAEVEKKAAGG